MQKFYGCNCNCTSMEEHSDQTFRLMDNKNDGTYCVSSGVAASQSQAQGSCRIRKQHTAAMQALSHMGPPLAQPLPCVRRRHNIVVAGTGIASCPAAVAWHDVRRRRGHERRGRVTSGSGTAAAVMQASSQMGPPLAQPLPCVRLATRRHGHSGGSHPAAVAQRWRRLGMVVWCGSLEPDEQTSWEVASCAGWGGGCGSF